jgi:hypothetical protein
VSIDDVARAAGQGRSQRDEAPPDEDEQPADRLPRTTPDEQETDRAEPRAFEGNRRIGSGGNPGHAQERDHRQEAGNDEAA